MSGQIKKIIRTSTSIFAGVAAKDIFKAKSKAKTLGEEIALNAAGSVAASVSYHLLKKDVVDLTQEITGGEQKLPKE